MKINNKSKIFMIISICVLFVSILGSTLAYYSSTLFADLNVDTITHGLDYYINYSKGQDISGVTLNRAVDYTTSDAYTDVTLSKKDNTYDIYGHIYLDVNEISNFLSVSPALKYTLASNGVEMTTGTLEGSVAGDSILIYQDIPLTTIEQTYTIYIWLDGNEMINAAAENETLSLSVRCEATMKKSTHVNVAQYITNLYTISEKTEVTNNSIVYNYATDVSLMNDRLGGTTSDYDAGNIRYYGANPNNYIYFNCSDYSNQTEATCEIWRIIGVFDGKIKIMRNSNIEKLAWDQNKNIDSSLTTYDNDWNNSSLQILLNEKYYNGSALGTITYYSGSSGGTTTTLDMSVIGIKNDTTRNLISEALWNLRGWNSASIYSNQMYQYERTTGKVYKDIVYQTSWVGKVALPYPSDYGYAADFNSCNLNLENYSNTLCSSVNWMKTILGSSTNSWFLTPTSSWNYFTYCLESANSLEYFGGCAYVYKENAVVPTLYLNSVLDINVELGDGTKEKPYQISLD